MPILASTAQGNTTAILPYVIAHYYTLDYSASGSRVMQHPALQQHLLAVPPHAATALFDPLPPPSIPLVLLDHHHHTAVR